MLAADADPVRECASSSRSGRSVQPAREVEAPGKSDKTPCSVSFLFPDLSNDRLFNPGRISLSTHKLSGQFMRLKRPLQWQSHRSLPPQSLASLGPAFGSGPQLMRLRRPLRHPLRGHSTGGHSSSRGVPARVPLQILMPPLPRFARYYWWFPTAVCGALPAPRAGTQNVLGPFGFRRDRSFRPHYITILDQARERPSFVLQKTAPHRKG